MKDTKRILAGLIIVIVLVFGVFGARPYEPEAKDIQQQQVDMPQIMKVMEATKIDVSKWDLKDSRGYLVHDVQGNQFVVVCDKIGCLKLEVKGWVEAKPGK